MKAEYFIDPEDRRFFFCDTGNIAVGISVTEIGKYSPAYTITGLMDTTNLQGLADILRDVQKPSGGEVEIEHRKDKDGESILVAFTPTSGNLTQSFAFRYHLEEFARYVQRSLAEAVDRYSTWNVPRREFIFQSGALELILQCAEK